MKDLLQRDASRQINPFYNHFFGDFDKSFNSGSYRLKENDSHYLASLDMPGVRREDIEVDISDNMLKVHASRETEGDSRDYTSSILLPKDVDTSEEVKAIYEDGVLKIAIAKSDSSSSRKIELSKDDNEGFFKRLFSSNSKKEVDVDKTKHQAS